MRPKKTFYMVVIAAGLFLVQGAGGNAAFASEVNIAGPKTEVRSLGGRPTFFVDGKPFTAPLFATYVPKEYYYKEMADIGCKLFNFQTNCSACDIGFSTPTWKGPDEWDFSQIDERARNILAADKNAWMLPRIYIGTPKWWYEKYPEEMIVLDNSKTTYTEPYNAVFNMKRPYASIVSPKWREDMGAALKKTVEHMLNSDYGKNIFGFEIAAMGSEEWYYMTVNQRTLGDYNPAMTKSFQNWLKKKYQTKEKLQASWNKKDIDFDKVQIPSNSERIGNENETFRHPEIEMHVIDYYIFYSDAVAETIDYFANIVKQTTDRKKVVGAFYDYFYEFRGGPEFGHNAGRTIAESKNVDFICAPPSYFQRQLGTGVEGYRRPFLTGTLHNKLWFHDNDLATFLFPKVMKKHNVTDENIKRNMEILAVTPTAQESIWLFQRSAGFVLCEGIYESFFDLHGGYFDDPRLLQALGNITKAIDRGKNYDRSSIAQILVVADEVSQAYMTFQSDYPDKPHKNRISEALLDFQLGFIKSGAPFDSALTTDLPLINLDQYKLVVFLNTWQIDEQTIKIINEKIKVVGKTILWCYAPGLFNGNKESAKAMSKLTGINITTATDESFIEPKMTLTDAGKKWMKDSNETPFNSTFGMDGKICKQISPADDSAQTLAVLAGTKIPAMAIKKIDGWTSVYTINSVMPASVVRTLAKTAGVHIFSTANDTLYANKSYISINAGTAGNRTIKLPFKADVYDALTENRWFAGVEQFDTSLMYGETQIFRYQPSDPNK